MAFPAAVIVRTPSRSTAKAARHQELDKANVFKAVHALGIYRLARERAQHVISAHRDVFQLAGRHHSAALSTARSADSAFGSPPTARVAMARTGRAAQMIDIPQVIQCVRSSLGRQECQELIILVHQAFRAPTVTRQPPCNRSAQTYWVGQL